MIVTTSTRFAGLFLKFNLYRPKKVISWKKEKRLENGKKTRTAPNLKMTTFTIS